MDGVLVIDKPQGITSHDVVAVARRSLGEKRIGHTGTLDPLATGVLPLACGRATRLVRFLAATEKEYDATIRIGLTTDTYDVTGREMARSEARPTREAVADGVAALTGDYLQTPPAFSAKKVAGRRAYTLARQQTPVELRAVPVRVARAQLLDFDGERARVTVTCSAGFYVRSYAHALGTHLGTGACLERLRRTRSGEFTLDRARSFDDLQSGSAGTSVIPIEELLPAWPAVHLTAEGRERVTHGREIEHEHLRLLAGASASAAPADWVRLVGPDDRLVALATPGARPGSLHPSVVLI